MSEAHALEQILEGGLLRWRAQSRATSRAAYEGIPPGATLERLRHVHEMLMESEKAVRELRQMLGDRELR